MSTTVVNRRASGCRPSGVRERWPFGSAQGRPLTSDRGDGMAILNAAKPRLLVVTGALPHHHRHGVAEGAMRWGGNGSAAIAWLSSRSIGDYQNCPRV